MATTVKRITFCFTKKMLKHMEVLKETYDENASQIIKRAIEKLHDSRKIKDGDK